MEWSSDVGYNFNGYYGFIYRIDYVDGSYYYGKKNFVTRTKRHFGKREIERLNDKRLKRYEWVQKESNWRVYEGSSKESAKKTIKKKTIIKLSKDKLNLTYDEAEVMFVNDVLRDDKCLNANILGKFYKGKI